MTDPLTTALAFTEPQPLAERRDLLLRWADLLAARAEDMARCITTATRKPIRLSRDEVQRGLATIRGTAAAMDQLAPQAVELGANGGAEIHRVPLGPVLAVTPFNFPLNLALHKLAPAIAAGCPVIWKPSPQAPGVAELALSWLREAGAPAVAVQLVQLANDEVAAMVRDPRLALLSFTGSVPVGHHLQGIAARAKVLLELGGNAVVILHQVDDLAAVARRVALGACAHAGQVCISIQRIFVPADRPEWRTALVQAFRDLPSGDPWDDKTLCGPVINQAAKARIALLLDRYREHGAKLLCGGGWQDLLLAPTLIDDLPADAPGVWDTEAFAPLATLHPYRSIDEAIDLAERTPFGLQAGLFSHDEAVIARAFARLNVGTLVVNDIPSRRDDSLPYGGMKHSGCGREGTRDTVLEYVQPKVLWRCAMPRG